MEVSNESAPAKPWDRQRGESAAAHRAFMDYCRMGKGTRSQRELVERYRRHADSGESAERPPTTSINTIIRWSHQNNWVERAGAWDAEQERIADERWMARRLEVRERDWEAGERLRQLGLQVIEQGPNFLRQHTKVINGKRFVFVALDVDAAVSTINLASRLQRQAAEVLPPGKGGRGHEEAARNQLADFARIMRDVAEEHRAEFDAFDAELDEPDPAEGEP